MADNLNNLANRHEVPPPATTLLVTGCDHNEPSYAVWRSRGTQDYLLLFTQSGTGRVGYSGGEVRCAPGQLVLIRPGVRHDYGTARGATHWGLVWAHFQPRSHWLRWLGWPEPAPGILSLASLPSETVELVGAALTKMDRLAQSALPQREAFAINALEEALLWCTTALGGEERGDPRIVRAMAYLTENLTRPLSLGEIAASVGLSVSRLSHLFREQVGLTPMQFLENERIGRARQLLRLTARPIAVIAAEVGFESAIHFSLRFKKAVGVSPRDFRQREISS